MSLRCLKASSAAWPISSRNDARAVRVMARATAHPSPANRISQCPEMIVAPRVAMHRNFRCNSRSARRRGRTAETEWLVIGDDEPHGKSHDRPAFPPRAWSGKCQAVFRKIMLERLLKRDGSVAPQVGNHWLQFPPKVVSQKLIKIRATRAARVTF